MSAKNKKLRIAQRYNQRCAYCGVALSIEEATIDHILPKCQNGTNDESNLALCCRECNGKKNNLNLEKFREKLKKEFPAWDGNFFFENFLKDNFLTRLENARKTL